VTSRGYSPAGPLHRRPRPGFITIISDGKKAGELPAALDDGDFAGALLGPLFFRRLIRKLPTDPAWIRARLQRTLATFGR
jgi:hypothetical protein